MKIKQIIKFLLASTPALVLGLMLSMDVNALPAAFNASYSVSKSGLTLGEMRTSLTYQGSNYRYYKTSKATGLVSWLSGDKISENATGSFQGNSLKPATYLYHHTSKRKDRKDQFKFISPRLVKGAYKDETYNIQVPHGTLDRATLELALARDVLAKKKKLTYSVVEKGKVKTYNLHRQGIEKVKISGKEYTVEKLLVVRKDSKRKTTFWLAKELGYMPVKINHVEKGDAIVTSLKWIKFITPKKK
jgi:hypothetical protein